MSELSKQFEGCKVVISPDKMRAWVNLAPPRGGKYSAEAIAAWLPENGVVYGADDAMIRSAAASGVYDDLLEVARGDAPVAAVGGDYTLKIEKKPFTGLRANSDGSLLYDDISFLQIVQPGQVLAEVTPATPEKDGKTVTGEVVKPREGTPGRELLGEGFEVSEDGLHYRAPGLGTVSFANDQLIVTPLKRLAEVSEADGEVSFEGSLMVDGDVLENSKISAGRSVYVLGRAVSCAIKAGNNVLLSGGMRSQGGGFGSIEAKGNVWGLFFESCSLKAGGDICANHISGCEVTAGGRVTALGGKGSISATNLFAANGVVANRLGDGGSDNSVIAVGIEQEYIDRYNTVNKKLERLELDIQSLQTGISAHERINRMKQDKGKNDASYKEMVKKRNQSLSVQTILSGERARLKRGMDQSSSVSVIVKDTACAGVTVVIDTRSMKLMTPMQRTKFRRAGETVEAISTGETR